MIWDLKILENFSGTDVCFCDKLWFLIYFAGVCIVCDWARRKVWDLRELLITYCSKTLGLLMGFARDKFIRDHLSSSSDWICLYVCVSVSVCMCLCLRVCVCLTILCCVCPHIGCFFVIIAWLSGSHFCRISFFFVSCKLTKTYFMMQSRKPECENFRAALAFWQNKRNPLKSNEWRWDMILFGPEDGNYCFLKLRCCDTCGC